MGFMQKFIKKKVSVQDVLFSLEKFSNDTKSLNELSQVASSFFGANWKFNLELFISTMVKKDKDKYLPIIRNVLTFDKAVALWLMAQQVLKGAKPLSSDIMKNIDEYEEYLPKFGVEGVRLLEKLKEKFNLSDDVIVLEKKVDVVPEKIEDEEATDTDVADNVVVEDVPDSVVASVEEVVEESPKSERILKRVSSKELEEGVFVKLPKKEEPVVVEDVPVEKVEEVVEVEKVSGTQGEIATDTSDSWELSNFVRVYSFVSQIREVMSAISLFEGAGSLEDYPYYGFIIDVIDYLISQGEKILSTQSEEVILKYFKGGSKELEEIVAFYKKQKQEEVIIPNDSEDTESEEK